MLKFRFVLIALVVLALAAVPVLNTAAQGPYYYCSVSITSGGAGTFYNPWACSTDAQRTNVWNTVCTYGGGTVYEISPGSYIMYFIAAPVNGVCQRTVSQVFQGYPPNTGVDLPAPVIYGGIAVIGIALLAAGMLIRRKQTAA